MHVRTCTQCTNTLLLSHSLTYQHLFPLLLTSHTHVCGVLTHTHTHMHTHSLSLSLSLLYTHKCWYKMFIMFTLYFSCCSLVSWGCCYCAVVTKTTPVCPLASGCSLLRWVIHMCHGSDWTEVSTLQSTSTHNWWDLHKKSIYLSPHYYLESCASGGISCWYGSPMLSKLKCRGHWKLPLVLKVWGWTWGYNLILENSVCYKNLSMNAGLIIREIAGKCYARAESDKVVTQGK
jgi:hypothetical protein